MKLTINPGCPASVCGVDVGVINVAHVTADSLTDRIHHIWSFVGKPTFFLAKGATNSTLSIDWPNFVGFTNESEKAVTIEPKPEYVVMTVLDRFYEFNDEEDTGKFDDIKDKNIAAYEPSLFAFNFNKSESRPDFVQFKVHATKYNDSNIGSINFNVQTYGTFDHGWNYPHLLHNSNSMQLDIVFDRFKVKKNHKGPRLAIQFAFITSDNKTSGITSYNITKRRTLDDEHTPGIFELDNIQTKSCYIEYRPVSYTHPERDVSTSTNTHLSPLKYPNLTWFENSLAFSYFGYSKDHLVQVTNISFGSTNDGFYTKTNYTSFTFLMGIGDAPTEELSKFIVIVGLVGVGVPLLLLFIGVSCICVKRVRTYRRLQEESQY